MLLCIRKTGIKVSVIVLKEAYLSIQEAVEDGHHKALKRHTGSKHETKTLTEKSRTLKQMLILTLSK